MQDSQSWSTVAGLREVTIVEMRNPITHEKKTGKKYTDFEVRLKTNSKAFTLQKSSVRRRYSEFVWLRNWLSENNEGFSSIRKTPSLPPKKLLGRFEEQFILDRMKGLQRFLRKVMEHNVFLSDKALHLFLQSNLTVKQIENYLTGKPVDFDNCPASTRRIMNDSESVTSRLEQRSLMRRTSWKSSLENIETLQRISEDSEQSSVSSEVTVAGATRRSTSGSQSECNGTNGNGDQVRENNSQGTGDDGPFRYESFSSLSAVTDSSQNDSTSQDGEVNAEEPSDGKISNSLTEDQQHLQCAKSAQDSSLGVARSPDYPKSTRPIMYSFDSDSGSEDSTTSDDGPESNYSVIDGSPTGACIPDVSDRGFMAVVPIIRSPSP